MTFQEIPRGSANQMNFNIAQTSLDNSTDTYERGTNVLSETDPQVVTILRALEDGNLTNEDAISALDELARRSVS